MIMVMINIQIERFEEQMRKTSPDLKIVLLIRLLSKGLVNIQFNQHECNFEFKISDSSHSYR